MAVSPKCIAVIPYRYGSTRFPGKPLAIIAGRLLLERVVALCKAIEGIEQVIVATDDLRIADECRKREIKVAMTPSTCENGSERCLAAVRELNLSPQIVINFQGDAPLIAPEIGSAIVSYLKADSAIEIATPAVRFSEQGYNRLLEEKAKGVVSGTTVVFDKNHRALYFSKNIIPFIRNPTTGPVPVYKHLGLYGYRFSALETFCSLPCSALEKLEGLEQLRALENGMTIQVIPFESLNRTMWSVDNPGDVQIVEEIIAREGEIIQRKP